MIKIDENYMIDVDKYNYTLVKDEHRTDKKGVAVFKTIGYYPSLESAVIACAEQHDKDTFAERDCTLRDAVEIITKTREKFNSLLREVLSHDQN